MAAQGPVSIDVSTNGYIEFMDEVDTSIGVLNRILCWAALDIEKDKAMEGFENKNGIGELGAQVRSETLQVMIAVAEFWVESSFYMTVEWGRSDRCRGGESWILGSTL